ncbi:NAD(P)-dependent oxidoreductase [Candidatus Gracilibacteria bacterium]|nr:NAD(P)-dependent oxidoreductase [Candidatus Gracilibacteria bacterium]
MKILLLGKTGLLGSEFLEIFSREGIPFEAPGHHELDLLNFDKVDQFLAGNFFDLILYCVAYTKVDQAETERGACEQLNVNVLRNILTHRRPIVHFSSDYVFNAPSNMAIPENFLRQPINFYGETKKQAEILLEHSGVDFWNIRTSWLFGTHGENFITKILDLSKEHDVLRIVADQVGRPTSTKDLAESVFKNFILNRSDSGHYHIQNSGTPGSWADFAEYFLQKQKWEGRVEPIASENLGKKALRPKNSVLLNTKSPENLRDWHEAVDEFLQTRQ